MRRSQQTPYYKILFKADFCKVFYTNARKLREHEGFSFHFHKPFSFKFWVLGEHQSANFGFWMVFLWSSPWTWKQTCFKFPAFLKLTNSDIKSFLSESYPTVFPTALWLWRIKKVYFNNPLSAQYFIQLVRNFRIGFLYIFNKHIKFKWRKFLNFGSVEV